MCLCVGPHFWLCACGLQTRSWIDLIDLSSECERFPGCMCMWELWGAGVCELLRDLGIASILALQHWPLALTKVKDFVVVVTVWMPPDHSLPLDTRLRPGQAGVLRVKSPGGQTASLVLASPVGCAPAVLAASWVCWDVQSPKH